jgi:serine protease Do
MLAVNLPQIASEVDHTYTFCSAIPKIMIPLTFATLIGQHFSLSQQIRHHFGRTFPNSVHLHPQPVLISIFANLIFILLLLTGHAPAAFLQNANAPGNASNTQPTPAPIRQSQTPVAAPLADDQTNNQPTTDTRIKGSQDTSRTRGSFEKLLQLQGLTQKIIQQSTPAVVAIGQTGSGVIVSPRGIVLTASHVTRVANRKVMVVMANGRIVEGITLGSNFASDTGAIRLLGNGPYPFVPVQDSRLVTPGSWCIAMGYPLSFPRGKPAASRLGRLVNRQDNGKLVTDCTIMGGDSGGPLLNLEGKVIAISSSVKLSIDQNLFIPSEQFIEDWKHIAMAIDTTGPQLAVKKQPAAPIQSTSSPPEAPTIGGTKITSRRPSKPYLGINAETDQTIVRIRAVHRQSPAEAAGIQPRDVIVALDATPITKFSQILDVLKKHRPRDEISMVVNRFGSLIALKVTLGGVPTK